MSQRPSLLDDADFSSIGTSKGAGGGGGGDRSRMIKIGALIAAVALAALVWTQPWNWGGAAVANPVAHQLTEEERIEFDRHQQQMDLEVERGRASVNGA
jgi:hypothetical protein